MPPAATRNYLALDLGAESGRAMIGRFDGKTIKLEETYRFGHTPVQYRGTNRWDVLQMAAHLRQGLASAAERAKGDLVSLGVDTWGVDYVLLDRNDDPLGYPFQYRDPRTDAAMPAAFEKVPAAEIYSVTGIQFMALNTIFQLYSEVMSGSERLAAARTLLFMPDFLSYTLGGEKTCEYSIASTSQMLDARRRDWARPLLKRLGIPSDMLQPVTMPGTATGTLLPSIAAATGAPKSMKIVAPGRHDTASAVAAVPAEGDGWAYLSSGTWSLFGAELPEPVISEQAMAASFTNEGGLGGTIRFLTNIMGLWLVQELRRAWTDKKGNAPDYATLAAEATQARAFGPIVNPAWAPFGKPGQMPEKFAKFCQATRQAVPQTRGEFVRCALESLALAYRAGKQSVEAMTGRAIERIHIVGGGSKNLLLNQLTADACNATVLAGPDEATALGSVLAQMLADRKIKNLAEGREIVRASCRPKKFAPKDTAAWDDAWLRFEKVRAKNPKF